MLDLEIQWKIWYSNERSGTPMKDLVLQWNIWYSNDRFGTPMKDLVYSNERSFMCKIILQFLVVWYSFWLFMLILNNNPAGAFSLKSCVPRYHKILFRSHTRFDNPMWDLVFSWNKILPLSYCPCSLIKYFW